MATLKQSTAYTRMFLIVQTADHLSGLTGASPTVTLSKAGGAFAAAGGTITEVSSGWYKIALNTTDTNTVGDLAYHVTATSGDATDFVDQVSSLILSDVNTTTPPTSAAIATAVWTDTTAGDFTTALSVGKSVMNGVALGTGLTVNDITTKTGYSLAGSQTFNMTGSITGSLSGSVGSVTGAVGSVTGLTASNLDATISSRMASYTQPTGFLAATFPTTVASPTNITSITGNITGNLSGSVGSVTGAVGSVTGAVGSVTGAVGSVTGNVGGNVTGSVGSVVGAVGSVTGAVGSIASGGIARASFAAETGLQSIRSNTAAGGGATSITLDASASATNDFYKNCLVYLTGGTGAGQSRFITAYVGSTKIATVTVWATNPDNTSTFAIMQFDTIPGATAPTAAQVATAVWTDTTASDFTTALSVGKSVMNGVTLGTGLTVNDITTKTGYSLSSSQTFNLTGSITGNLSGSVGSVTGAVGSVTGAVGSVTGLTASDVGAIKTKTDSLGFTVAGYADVNIRYVNSVHVTGDGAGTPWGP